jgi:hypothetical protein
MTIICDNATIGCDYLGATVNDETELLVSHLSTWLGTEPITCAAPKGYGYPAAVSFPKGDDNLATVLHSANRLPFVLAQGYRAPAVFDALRARYPVTSNDEAVTAARRDTAVDLDDPDWFEVVYLVAAKLANRLKLVTDMRGDWTSPGSPKGRSFYVGSRDSMHLVRIYEHRKYHGYGAAVRIELETKPQKRDHKRWLYIATDVECIVGSRAMRGILEEIGVDVNAARPRLHFKPPSDLERGLNALLAQYGRLLRDELVPHLGGDLSELGPALMRRLAEIETHRAKVKHAAASRAAASIHDPRSFIAVAPPGE